ncbi:alpha-glucuronidase [Sediminibacillus dalangtanensis]|uniref:Xylan alpha-1,2-glucuronidase n=1 Tax=Sediminibacillus dalangtanensis TaxID=2729421 RepID=A0ABX7VV02_9BACI|nr:alpha-glucuronidase family glycosyl hydrolase [Sediminibacillus dalangtanensis]QTN00792.1 alpha-glucuronidase [Sediminibacillus dalangtanensis]
MSNTDSYQAWLQYRPIGTKKEEYKKWLTAIEVNEESQILESAAAELKKGIHSMLGVTLVPDNSAEGHIILGTYEQMDLKQYGISPEVFRDVTDEGYVLKSVFEKEERAVLLIGKTDRGALYAAFHLLRLLQKEVPIDSLEVVESPRNQFRMINQWDNMDGSIERGYAGQSIFYVDNDFNEDLTRVKDYARLLASVGINAISINNVNVWDVETKLVTKAFLPKVKAVSAIFAAYGIRSFLSINFASPMELGGLGTADPLSPEVEKWWKDKVAEIYEYIPDFGGFIVKADSEGRPGPFTYDRGHVEGANVLAKALKPFEGKVIWRCFVYNHLQDWRDRSTDRARAAYDHFKPLDGKFLENVILQIKNGPMDFQVREPVSPLLGAMKQTNQMLEFQIAQEYTGQQIDVCYLIPQWKEVLDFDTYTKGEGSTIKSIVDGTLHGYQYSGIAAVSNIGDDGNWTGHTLAQANLYGYGRLIWNPERTTEEITKDWIHLTFGYDPDVVDAVEYILLHSWKVYEKYTAPLGIGWMVNPNHHYGPNVDGYEYSKWGTYHFADRDGIGVDRTVETGTGYSSQYEEPNAKVYDSLELCPDELLLFFHHVPYSHRLKSGETVIQHIYTTHFEGVEEVETFIAKWNGIEGKVDNAVFENVKQRLKKQRDNAIEWRDQVNTYFYRKSGIPDQQNRTIHP